LEIDLWAARATKHVFNDVVGAVEESDLAATVVQFLNSFLGAGTHKVQTNPQGENPSR
jgi:hypothetical protein